MNRDPRGLYAALHVAPGATAAEIRQSFRALMRLRHPDLEASSGTGPADAGEVRRILESFAVLRNAASRAEYDPAAAGAPTPGSAAAPPPAEASGSPAAHTEIPVRFHPVRQPVLRVTPVRWERGPE
ncbi:DnaJ domain-containing protein [Arthrobacter sp. B3I4]|uniref:J domain-containing protein n=1 Tax=Arthrobacter sp. B3I4 TaxID=3042267 RepID=UPI00277D86D2|nr:DnaJ domain-containing protein [Arthrobacter sp. B3I4]MDQ0755170.1 DnaJ-class molecular chaperone [Arthrobacter sp. B3I4]